MTTKLVCECGIVVRGTSDKHCEANMRQHKGSRMHRELMKFKEVGEGKIEENGGKNDD